MTRALRKNVKDGWYHVYHRGTNHGVVFTEARDREHFLELLEKARGLSWAKFSIIRGDCAKPLVLMLARRYSGMTLREIGDTVGGMDYAAVSIAIKRFEKRMQEDKVVAEVAKRAREVLNVET